MDFQEISKAVAVPEILFDDFDEQPVDCDFVLPDYCPDIAAVLRCTMRPVIQSKQMSGDRLTAEGQAMSRVMYLDEGRKCVRCCEFSQPFTSSFAVRGAGVGAEVRLTAKTDYINCRATSPRRLDLHGAFTVKLKIIAEGQCNVITSVGGEGLYARRQPVAYSVPAVSAEKPFTVSEVLELGAGKPPAEALIRAEAIPCLTECKLLANKAIVKGELLLKNLYVSDIAAGTMDKAEHTIPFSQIVDVDGMNEDWACDVQLDVISSDIHITVNQNGESTLLSVSVKILAQLQCTRSASCDVVTDMYSVRCPLKLETTHLDTENLIGIRRGESVVKEEMELPPEGVAEIIDIWCDAAPTECRCGDGKAAVDGKMTIAMLARDAAGVVGYYERPGTFSLEFDEDCSRMDAHLAVTRVEYTASGSDKVELRIELAVTRACYRTQSCTAVTAMSADESAGFPEEKAALKIYYANGGESLWEIAKSCHTSMEAVMEENGLAADVLGSDAMLLVPLC